MKFLNLYYNEHIIRYYFYFVHKWPAISIIRTLKENEIFSVPFSLLKFMILN